ncbi:hypothetical protein ACEPPN_011872 [Leptodophora sp. 'Broadleaf-Isolate-01']
MGFGAPLGLFVPHESFLAKRNLITGRPIAKRADSEACFDLIRSWMDECLVGHGHFCPSSVISSLPTRVIDVGNAETPPKVVITNGDSGRWLALSHCWGTNVRFVLESSNLLARQQSLSLEDMPSTFSDAIQATRRLGYKYLWVDSLCVIQDSHDDWAFKSSQMLSYY